jgi:hypothetical protein
MSDTNNKTLNLYPIDYPFETLIARVKSKKLILDPDFQRKYKWDKDGNERASKFIESCLMRIPLPACYFVENNDNSQEVIDGVQRITTIVNFYNDEFALEGLSVFKELEGKKFSEIGDLKSDFETTTIRCIILRKDNPKEIVNEIFARLNQGAVELTPQEIRHAVYPGKFNSLLIELAENSVIKNFKTTENSITQKDGREAEEMILRFFALNNNLDDYNNKLSKYLDKYMEGMHQSNEDEIASKKELFGKTLNRVLKVFNEEDLFKNLGRSQQRQSIAIYDLVMYTFSNLTDEFVDQNKVELYNKFKELFENEEFNKTLSGGVQQKYSILKRRDLLKEKIDTLI